MDPKWPKPPGLRILIPGAPQWSWRQTDRATILFGSYVASVVVGVMTWGTMVGLLLLGFAFATHAFSAADAIRQCAFPGFGRMVPAISASAGLGALCYGPAMALGAVFAWPIVPEERPREGYLVNRWAYEAGAEPRPGEVVWLRPARVARPRVARVIAGPGQRVEWAGGELQVDGQVVDDSPFRVAGEPREIRFAIPAGNVLVAYGAEKLEKQAIPGAWEIVDRNDVQGQAWARSYPFWGRRLLR